VFFEGAEHGVQEGGEKSKVDSGGGRTDPPECNTLPPRLWNVKSSETKLTGEKLPKLAFWFFSGGKGGRKKGSRTMPFIKHTVGRPD